jgi:hypothetical protein
MSVVGDERPSELSSMAKMSLPEMNADLSCHPERSRSDRDDEVEGSMYLFGEELVASS